MASHVGEHVGLGVVEDGSELRHLRADLVGDGTPLGAGGLGCLPGKAVAMKVETTRRPLLPACASTFLMKWTRQSDRVRRDEALRPEILRVFEENWRV